MSEQETLFSLSVLMRCLSRRKGNAQSCGASAGNFVRTAPKKTPSTCASFRGLFDPTPLPGQDARVFNVVASVGYARARRSSLARARAAAAAAATAAAFCRGQRVLRRIFESIDWVERGEPWLAFSWVSNPASTRAERCVAAAHARNPSRPPQNVRRLQSDVETWQALLFGRITHRVTLVFWGGGLSAPPASASASAKKNSTRAGQIAE